MADSTSTHILKLVATLDTSDIQRKLRSIQGSTVRISPARSTITGNTTVQNSFYTRLPGLLNSLTNAIQRLTSQLQTFIRQANASVTKAQINMPANGMARTPMAIALSDSRRPRVKTRAPAGIDQGIWDVVGAGRTLSPQEAAMVRAGKPIGPPKPAANFKHDVQVGRQLAGYIAGSIMTDLGHTFRYAGKTKTASYLEVGGAVLGSGAQGAYVGSQFGGPVGAGIGALAGTLLGLLQQGVKTFTDYSKSIEENIEAHHKFMAQLEKGIGEINKLHKDYFSKRDWNMPENLTAENYEKASAKRDYLIANLRQVEQEFTRVTDEQNIIRSKHFDELLSIASDPRMFSTGRRQELVEAENIRYEKQVQDLFERFGEAAKRVDTFSKNLKEFEGIYAQVKRAREERDMLRFTRQVQGETFANAFGETIGRTSGAINFENESKRLEYRLQTILASNASARSKFNDISEMYDNYILERNLRSEDRDKAIKNAKSLADSVWMTNASVSQAPFANFFRQIAANDANKAISDATTALNMQQSLADAVGNALAKISESLVRPDMTAVTSIAQYGYGMGERDNGTQRVENYLARQTNLQEQINEKLREGIRSSATYVD